MSSHTKSLVAARCAPQQIGPVVTCLDDVAESEIQWLWPGRIPLGRITLLVGRPGEGKSFLTCDMAARVSKGDRWPDGSDCPSGSVLLISAEDDPADTIRPRLDACGADVERVNLLYAVRRMGTDGKPYEAMFTLADVAALEAALKKLPDCRLIVVDPVESFIGRDVDIRCENQVRPLLAPVARLAQKYNVAVLVVASWPSSFLDGPDNGHAIAGADRVAWHLSRDTNNKSRRLLLPGKNNLAPKSNGLAFTIAGDPASIVWESEPLKVRS